MWMQLLKGTQDTDRPGMPCPTEWTVEGGTSRPFPTSCITERRKRSYWERLSSNGSQTTRPHSIDSGAPRSAGRENFRIKSQSSCSGGRCHGYPKSPGLCLTWVGAGRCLPQGARMTEMVWRVVSDRAPQNPRGIGETKSLSHAVTPLSSPGTRQVLC